MGKKKARPWRTANPDMAKAMQELRRSSAAQPHVPAPRKGTRAERDRKARQDYADYEERGDR